MNDHANGIDPFQIDQIKNIRQEWSRVALNTEPIDRTEVADAVRELHIVMNVPAPQRVLVLPSPLMCQIAYQFLRRQQWDLFEGHDAVLNVSAKLESWIHSNMDDWTNDDFVPTPMPQYAHARSILKAIVPSLPTLLVEQLAEQPLRPDSIPLEAVFSVEIYPERHSCPTADVAHAFRKRHGEDGETALWNLLGADQQFQSDMIFRQVDLAIDKDLCADEFGGRGQIEPLLRGGSNVLDLTFVESAVLLGLELDKDQISYWSARRRYEKSGGWLYSFADLSLVSDRPCMIKLVGTSEEAAVSTIQYRDHWTVTWK